MSEDPVLFAEQAAEGGRRIGVITLNVESSLNSLSLEMTDLIQTRLCAWEQDAKIACLFLQASGEKAFCAGGDIRHLYESMVETGAGHNQYAQDFWEREYRLDHHIHVYPKPIVVWATGIVMGGGMGLVVGGSHRVVTETTRMAMPEVGIGLYPDVAGTWFLHHAPGRSGLFVGLTGVSMNGADALTMQLGDWFISSDQRQQVLAALRAVEWLDDSGQHDDQVSGVLRAFEYQSRDDRPSDNILVHQDAIRRLTDPDTVDETVDAITAYDGDDKWLAKAARGLKHACPASVVLAYEQFKRGADLDLREAFQMELIMSINCARYGNFQEGVRALIIDKDRSPQYSPATVAEVSPRFIDQHFVAPWGEQRHPLDDL